MPAPRRPRPRKGYLRTESEEAFQVAVIQLARFEGWHVWHPPKNRPGKSGRVIAQLGVVAGWPDLALARLHADLHAGLGDRAGEFMLAELKGEATRVTPAQLQAHALLRACGVEVRLWRPRDWPAICERLAR